MTNVCFSYERGTVPQITVQLETATGRKRLLGEIDSGSVRSLCPLVFAEDLGVTDNLVKAKERGEPAIGGKFDLWIADKTGIQGQIMVPASDREELVGWGSLFAMDIAFAETDTLLLGQSDFFAAFDVKFLSRDGDGYIEICPPPPKPRGP